MPGVRSMASNYTPTQRRLLAVLKDGEPHTPQELHSCLVDDLGPVANVQPHITALRKILRARGQEIVCEIVAGSTYYRVCKTAAYKR